MAEGTVPVVQTERADVVETIHRGAAAIVDVQGNLVARVGHPDAVYYVRSSGKPLQAVAAAETGAFDRFQYTDAQIALAAASHSGEIAHITELDATMAKVGIREEDLICGLSYPAYDRRRSEMIRAGEPPSRRHHNCSGKHCAMIAAARARSEDVASYWRPDHPHQRRILQLIGEMADYPADRIRLGVDGCGVPVHALPLRHVALAFARLVDPSGFSAERQRACLQVTSAMTRYPYLVAGSERFDTVLIAAGGGHIVCKGGALGYFAAGITPDDPDKPAIGLALKIEDGSHMPACQMALEILDQLGVIDEQHRWRLAAWHEAPVRNSLNQVVGCSRPVFNLVIEEP
jgi:L-asparaginase II